MRRILYLCIFIFCTQNVFAQQYPLFTNYILNCYGFNPAIAGSNTYWDGRATYRTQWTGIDGGPKTQIISLHGPVKNVGVGGYFFNDSAGKLNRTGGTGTLSYGMDVAGLGDLRAGLGLNVFNFRLKDDPSNIGTPDPVLVDGMATTVVDVSAGLYFRMRNGLFVGLSAPQILKQNLDFTDEEVPDRNLVPHYYFMAGYPLKVSEKITLEPSVLLKYTDTAPMQYDFSLRAFLSEKLWLGGTYRHQAAATGMIGYELSPAINLAYAYDMTLNGIKDVHRNSHEITLGFKFGLPKDRDGDGIVDEEDECPDVPGPELNEGCPEEGDRDKDGLADKIDKCPDVFGIATNQGCPSDDRDLDGIVDAKDKCPDIPGSFIKEGCPENDADGDLVTDDIDKCPETPGVPSNDGCPIATEGEKAILDLAIQNLYFDTNKAKIKAESYRFLDKLAELLVERKAYRVKIEGHTDSRGDEKHNYELSKNRSDSVRNYLVNRGVSEGQLFIEYYGEQRPVASNVSEETRRLNRRVEMSFVWD